MSNHFSYLYEDDESDFFQKQANSSAEDSRPRANEIVKTASAPEPLDVYGLEKVAQRLDSDLFIVKTAGPSGMNFGTQQRAASYMAKFAERIDMSIETMEEVYDSFAAEAITHDLGIVRDEFYKLAEEEHYDWVNAQIASAGTDLVEAAQLEKEAFIGIARTLGAARKGLKATKGLGFTARAKSVATAPQRAFRQRRVEVAAAKRSKAGVKLEKAKSKLKTMQARAAAKAKATAKLPAGLRRSVGPGVTGRATKKVDKASARVTKREGQLEAATTKHKGRKLIEQGKAPKTTKPSESPAAAKQTDDIAKRKADAKATDKSVSDDLKKKTEAKGGEGTRAAAETADDAAKVTLGGAAKKMRDQGWGSLSGDEKQKLINAGLAGVVGHRVVMGKGALTGGEGII